MYYNLSTVQLLQCRRLSGWSDQGRIPGRLCQVDPLVLHKRLMTVRNVVFAEVAAREPNSLPKERVIYLRERWVRVM